MIYFISVIFISALLITALLGWHAGMKLKQQNARFDKAEKEKINYESIIEQANDAMMVIDIVDGKVHQCNPSACAMLGYTKAELESKTLFDLQPPSLMQRSSQVVADVWEQKGLIFSDIPFVTASGAQVPVECSAKVAPFAGRPAIVIYARDITERLRLQKEISEQQEIIKTKNKDITDSINYARRIQTAILPTEQEIARHLSDHFILYKPKDIVSGDFYWFSTVVTTKPDAPVQNRLVILAAVDCTGHGVPGAFMSLVGSTLLNQTITDPDVNSPAEALNYLNRELRRTLRREVGDNSIRDGMDMTLVAIDLENKKMQFAGANNPVFVIRKHELIELKGDKQPIGSDSDELKKPFTNTSFDLQTGDCIYLFTDGFTDQFGGPRGKKFKISQFKECLLSMQSRPMKEQKIMLDNRIEEWKAFPNPAGGMYEQVDDIMVIGLRV
ncbi:MAG: SpoIIE family protein phosphatase [Bacteroidia bacterium]